MYWIELHFLNFLDENIQVGHMSNFESIKNIERFDPKNEDY
jgi:hypothetical protein